MQPDSRTILTIGALFILAFGVIVSTTIYPERVYLEGDKVVTVNPYFEGDKVLTLISIVFAFWFAAKNGQKVAEETIKAMRETV